MYRYIIRGNYKKKYTYCMDINRKSYDGALVEEHKTYNINSLFWL